MNNRKEIAPAADAEAGGDMNHFAARSLEKLKKNKAAQQSASTEIGRLAQSKLLEMLGSEDHQERVRGARLLVETGDPEILPKLCETLSREGNEFVVATLVKTVASLADDPSYIDVIKPFLSHENARVRANTIEAMGMFDDPRIFKIVAPFIKERNNRIKANVAKIMWGYSQDKTLRYLKEMLDSEDVWTCYSAVFALAEIGHYKTRALLIYSLLNPNISIRLRSARALHEMDEALSDDMSQLVLSLEDRRIYSIPSRVVNYQVKLLDSQSPRERGAGARILFHVASPGDRSVVEGLRRMMARETDETVMGPGILALLKIARAEALDVAEPFIRNVNSRLRADVIEGLEFIDDPGILEVVIPCLKDQSNRVRANAAKVMWRFSGEKTMDLVLEMLRSGDEAAMKSGAYILGEIADEGARDMLIRLVAEAPGPVAEFAGERLMKVNRRLGRRNRYRGQSQSRASIPLTENPGRFIDRNADLLVDTDFTVRRRAVEVLSAVVGSGTFKHFRDRLEREANPFIRATLVKVVSCYRGDETIDLLREFLTDEDTRVRSNTVEALGEVGSASVISLVTPMLKDPAQRVRESAAVVIWKISEDRDFDRLKRMVEEFRGALRATAEAVSNPVREEYREPEPVGASSLEGPGAAAPAPEEEEFTELLDEIDRSIENIVGPDVSAAQGRDSAANEGKAQAEPSEKTPEISSGPVSEAGRGGVSPAGRSSLGVPSTREKVKKFTDRSKTVEANVPTPKRQSGTPAWLPWTIAAVLVAMNLVGMHLMLNRDKGAPKGADPASIAQSGAKTGDGKGRMPAGAVMPSSDQSVEPGGNSSVDDAVAATAAGVNAENPSDGSGDGFQGPAAVSAAGPAPGTSAGDPIHLSGGTDEAGDGSAGGLDETAQPGEPAAPKADPAKAALAFEEGSKFYDAGDFRGARSAFERALSLDPALAKAGYMAALCLSQEGRISEAVEALRKLVASDPANTDAMFALADLLARTNRPDDALKQFARILELVPRDTAAMNASGRILAGLGRHQDAIGMFSGSIAVMEGADIILSRGQSSLALGRLNDALADFQLAAKRDPSMAGAYLGMARINLLKKWLSQARENVKDALGRAPEDPDARLMNAEVMLAFEEIEAARTEIEAVLAGGNDSARAYFLLGEVFRSNMAYADALKFYGEALNRNPSDPEAYFRRGQCYEELKDFEGAAAEYRSALILVEGTGLELEGVLKTELAKLEPSLGAGPERNSANTTPVKPGTEKKSVDDQWKANKYGRDR